MTAPHPRPLAIVPAPGGGRAARLAHDLGTRFAALADAARRARKLDDREASHDLRVASRRLTSAIRLWRPLLDEPAARRLLRRLDRLRRAGGRLRDAEVHAALLRELAPDLTGAERLAAEALASRVERRIPRFARRTARRASRRRIDRLVAAFGAAMAPLAAGAVPDGGFASAREELMRLEHEARAALAAAFRSDDDAHLHRARIAVKQWRYAREALHAVFADGTHAPAARGEETRLREIQRALGRIQDLAALRARIERRARRLQEKDRSAESDALLGLLPRLQSARAAPLGAVQRLADPAAGAAGVLRD